MENPKLLLECWIYKPIIIILLKTYNLREVTKSLTYNRIRQNKQEI